MIPPQQITTALWWCTNLDRLLPATRNLWRLVPARSPTIAQQSVLSPLWPVACSLAYYRTAVCALAFVACRSHACTCLFFCTQASFPSAFRSCSFALLSLLAYRCQEKQLGSLLLPPTHQVQGIEKDWLCRVRQPGSQCCGPFFCTRGHSLSATPFARLTSAGPICCRNVAARRDIICEAVHFQVHPC